MDIATLAIGTATVGGAIRQTYEIVKAAKSIDDAVKRNETLAEVQQRLVELGSAHLDEIEKREAAIKRADALEKKLLEMDDFRRRAELYKILSPCLGNFVYTDTKPPKDGECKRWYCPCCFENMKLRTLQTAAKDGRNPAQSLDLTLKCFGCGFSFVMLRSEAERLLRG